MTDRAPFDPGEFQLPPRALLDEAHAEQRARERYGARLTARDRDDMTRQVREGRGIFLSSSTGFRHLKVWLVWWPSLGRIVPIYYRQGRIKSVLPPAAAADLIKKLERSLSSRLACGESGHD